MRMVNPIEHPSLQPEAILCGVAALTAQSPSKRSVRSIRIRSGGMCCVQHCRGTHHCAWSSETLQIRCRYKTTPRTPRLAPEPVRTTAARALVLIMALVRVASALVIARNSHGCVRHTWFALSWSSSVRRGFDASFSLLE